MSGTWEAIQRSNKSLKQTSFVTAPHIAKQFCPVPAPINLVFVATKMKPLEPPDTHHLNAAQGWLELGNSFEADSELENMTPALRSHPAVLELRWQIYAKEEKWEACVDIGEAMVKLAFDLPEGWIHRSFALHELKRTEEAADKLEAAADLFPSISTIPYNLACYACVLGKLSEAQEWLRDAFDLADDKKAIKLTALDDPDLERLWVEIGEI
jgi:tetratricopeptide (TPR) repeat protein